MIKQVFNVESYWKVIVYYDVDYNFFDIIATEFRQYNASISSINDIYSIMSQGKAKAVTYSNIDKHVSIVLFNRHRSKEDYINSLVHEAEHIKQAMLDAYRVKDEGEPPAYTVGYLVMKMWEMFKSMY
jgi:hypothetical protein